MYHPLTVSLKAWRMLTGTEKEEQENPERLLVIKYCISSGMRMHNNP